MTRYQATTSPSFGAAVRPCRRALLEDAVLPPEVRGPVLFLEFVRFAAICLSVVIPRFPHLRPSEGGRPGGGRNPPADAAFGFQAPRVASRATPIALTRDCRPWQRSRLG